MSDEQKAVPMALIRELLKACEDAFEPVVKYDKDNNVMLARAYDKRGEALYRINSRIRCHLPPDFKL